MTTETRAEWTAAYINDLPDSAFACIDPGGTKDEDGKTVPRSLRHYPHHDASGAVDPAHLANARARVAQEGTTSCGRDHLMNHDVPERDAPPPREGYRAMSWPSEYRDAEADRPPRIVGHFARFGVFNEINSVREGRFMERINEDAFTRTFKNNRSRIRVLFQHGKDPSVGEKPIARLTDLRSDSVGGYYEAELLDGIDPLVLDGLRHGQYGVSYRFQVAREEYREKPGKSPANPKGLPERDILEAQVFELGPVTFPADPGADIVVRSITDEVASPAVLPILANTSTTNSATTVTITGTATTGTYDFSWPDAPSDGPEETPHPVVEARDDPPPPSAATTPNDPPNGGSSDSRSKAVGSSIDISQYKTLEDMLARHKELNSEIKRMADLPGVLPEQDQAAFNDRVEERGLLEAAIVAWRGRLAQVRATIDDEDETDDRGNGGGKVVPGFQTPTIVRTRDEASIYDVRRMEREARSEDHFSHLLYDNAMRAVEAATFGATDRQTSQGQLQALLKGKDQVEPDEAAKRVLFTGSPAYRRAYRKYLTQGAAGPHFTAEESNAFDEARTALVTASNVAVPFDLDSTMAINTSGAINPFRQAFRVVQTTSNDWRPLVSSGMTAVYEDEATAATDLSPAFTAPARLLVKAHTAATFSVEIQGDYPGLEAELSREIADAKDVLEATEFSTGAGTTHHPDGIFTYYTLNFLDTATTLVIVPSDLYKLEANIGPRYRGNTVWLGSPYFYSLVRGIDTAGGAGLWVDNLSLGSFGSMENNGRLGNLLGHPAYEAIAPANTSMATTEKVAILASRDHFVIIDRIGMNIELIPNFVDTTTGYPTGQRMVYAWWRNTSTGIGLNTLGAGRAACIFRGK